MKRVIQIICFVLVVIITNSAFAQWQIDTLPTGSRYALAAASSGNAAIFAGGIGMISSPPAVADKYFESTMAWGPSTISKGRNFLAGAAAGDKIVFAGGANDWILSVYDRVDIFTTATNSWLPFTAMSAARSHLAGAGAGTKVVFVGGQSWSAGTISNVVDIYDVVAGTWTATTLSIPRYSLCAASSGDVIVFAGGTATGGVSNAVDIYNVTTNTWTTATLSEARSNAAAVGLGGKIYIGGGFSAAGVSNRVDIYDVTTNTWSIDSLSQAREWLSASANGNLVMFAGGAGQSGTPVYGTIDILDTTAGTWSTAQLTIPRYMGAATSIASRIMFGGGSTATGITATVEIYTLLSSGLNDISIDDFLVYPNPASSTINVESVIHNGEVFQIEIMNVAGQQVKKITVPANVPVTKISIEEFDNGVYFYNILKNGSMVKTARFVVAK